MAIPDLGQLKHGPQPALPGEIRQLAVPTAYVNQIDSLAVNNDGTITVTLSASHGQQESAPVGFTVPAGLLWQLIGAVEELMPRALEHMGRSIPVYLEGLTRAVAQRMGVAVPDEAEVRAEEEGDVEALRAEARRQREAMDGA